MPYHIIVFNPFIELGLDFDNFSIMSMYLPSGTNLDRLQHKLEYMAMFQEYVNKLKSFI